MTAVLPRLRRKIQASREASPIKSSEQTIENLADTFKMLSDPSRLKILLALGQDGELNVSSLCQLLDESQPAVSHHLTLLRRRHLVSFRRDGKNNYYRLDSSLIGYLLEQFFTSEGNGQAQIQLGDFALIYRRK